MMQMAVGDVPTNCSACAAVTLHRRGVDGRLHCLPCMMSAMQVRPEVLAPQHPHVIQVQQKVGGGVVRSTIDAAKFILALVFLLFMGTCVYVCGSAANAVQ